MKKKYSISKKGTKLQPRPQEVKDKISMKNKGRKREDVSGENNKLSRFSNKDVEAIKLRILNRDKIRTISEDYNCDISVIYDIKNRVTWKHIFPDLDLTNSTQQGKLSSKDVVEIRKMLDEDKTETNIKNISLIYKVTKLCIKNIMNFKTWKSVS